MAPHGRCRGEWVKRVDNKERHQSACGQWSICIRVLSSSLHRSRDVCFGQREKLSSASYLIPPLPFAPFMTSACFCFVTGLIDWLCGYASHIGVIRYRK